MEFPAGHGFALRDGVLAARSAAAARDGGESTDPDDPRLPPLRLGVSYAATAAPGGGEWTPTGPGPPASSRAPPPRSSAPPPSGTAPPSTPSCSTTTRSPTTRNPTPSPRSTPTTSAPAAAARSSSDAFLSTSSTPSGHLLLVYLSSCASNQEPTSTRRAEYSFFFFSMPTAEYYSTPLQQLQSMFSHKKSAPRRMLLW
ncbi:uncharacterized protein [Lolium perenne]|uniref:uncharacterized protein isoform X2 n=1 Tax=Lolium perenne TaxID=4522 RepID=UPI0021F658DA|nr:leucine-rich repeat extensin-like protein 5 isoform X2 [Lolium perenne]